MGQVIVSDYPTSLRQTRLTKRKETTNLTNNVFDSVEIELKVLAEKLYTELTKEMYDNDTKKIIEEVRNVCDLKSAAKLVKQEGGVMTGMKIAGKFAESAKKLTPTLSDIDPAVLEDAFKNVFLNWNHMWQR